jgi:ribokinase
VCASFFSFKKQEGDEDEKTARRERRRRDLKVQLPVNSLPAGTLLSVIGAINWDTTIFEERFARSGEEVPVKAVEECSGGKGANVAVAAARILGKGRVAFLGALGDDDLYNKQVSELGREGVLTSGVLMIRNCSSGRAYMLVDGSGRKTIHTHFGANDRIPQQALFSGKEREMLLARTAMIIIMDAPTSVSETAAKAARRRGATVIYSPGVRARDGLKAIEPIIDLCHIFVVDRVELTNLFKKKRVEDALRAVLDFRPHMTVVTTLGERGCVITKDGSNSNLDGIDLSKLGMKPVNTTGCGDAFLGAFATSVLLGSNIKDAAMWGNLAGAIKATKYETRGSPSRVELETATRTLEKVSVRRARWASPRSRAA